MSKNLLDLEVLLGIYPDLSLKSRVFFLNELIFSGVIDIKEALNILDEHNKVLSNEK